MNAVWIAGIGYYYDGWEILGVFSSEDSAKKFVENLVKEKNIEIEEDIKDLLELIPDETYFPSKFELTEENRWKGDHNSYIFIKEHPLVGGDESDLQIN